MNTEPIVLVPAQTLVDWEFIERVYLDRFPPEERRDFEEIKRLHREPSPLSVYCIRRAEVNVGFITIWKLEGFLFIEHFAIAQPFAQQGLGTQALKALIASTSLPIVLEAEPPECSPIAKRRIGFYSRNGFILLENDYLQPAYSPTLSPVPLKIMQHPNGNPLLDFQTLKGEIYRVVYRLSSN